MMVGRRAFPIGFGNFSGAISVKLREGTVIGFARGKISLPNQDLNGTSLELHERDGLQGWKMLVVYTKKIIGSSGLGTY